MRLRHQIIVFDEDGNQIDNSAVYSTEVDTHGALASSGAKILFNFKPGFGGKFFLKTAEGKSEEIALEVNFLGEPNIYTKSDLLVQWVDGESIGKKFAVTIAHPQRYEDGKVFQKIWRTNSLVSGAELPEDPRNQNEKLKFCFEDPTCNFKIYRTKNAPGVKLVLELLELDGIDLPLSSYRNSDIPFVTETFSFIWSSKNYEYAKDPYSSIFISTASHPEMSAKISTLSPRKGLMVIAINGKDLKVGKEQSTEESLLTLDRELAAESVTLKLLQLDYVYSTPRLNSIGETYNSLKPEEREKIFEVKIK